MIPSKPIAPSSCIQLSTWRQSREAGHRRSVPFTGNSSKNSSSFLRRSASGKVHMQLAISVHQQIKAHQGRRCFCRESANARFGRM